MAYRIRRSKSVQASVRKIALEQIRNRGYAVAYQNRGKPILLLGIAFDTEQRNLADWQSEQV